MEREKIYIKDLSDANYPDDIDGFSIVQKEEENFDTEKGFIDFVCIAKRKSDEKFFKFKYTQYGYGGSNLAQQSMTEVFPMEKTITVYL